MPEEQQFNTEPSLDVGQGLRFPLDPQTKKIILDIIKKDDKYVAKDGTSVYTATGDGFKDEDNMSSDSATATASQQSIKKYVDDTAVTDHGGLTGLADDDHTQYHNNTRGDARYLQNLVEDTTPQLGGTLVLNSQVIEFPSVNNISDCKDENDMATDSDSMLATQQSIKAYVDSKSVLNASMGTGTTLTLGEWLIPHGLGVVPSLIQVKAIVAISGELLISTGSGTGVGSTGCVFGALNNSSGEEAGVNANIINLDDEGGSKVWDGALTTLDATNIGITVDKSGAPPALNIVWSVAQ